MPAKMAQPRRGILVAEDQYLIAEELVRVLTMSGAEVIGPLPTVGHALEALEINGDLAGAVLDVDLNGEAIWPVVAALVERGVPVVLATGFGAGVVPKEYAGLRRLQKPISLSEIEGLAAAWSAPCRS